MNKEGNTEDCYEQGQCRKNLVSSTRREQNTIRVPVSRKALPPSRCDHRSCEDRYLILGQGNRLELSPVHRSRKHQKVRNLKSFTNCSFTNQAHDLYQVFNAPVYFVSYLTQVRGVALEFAQEPALRKKSCGNDRYRRIWALSS